MNLNYYLNKHGIILIFVLFSPIVFLKAHKAQICVIHERRVDAFTRNKRFQSFILFFPLENSQEASDNLQQCDV